MLKIHNFRFLLRGSYHITISKCDNSSKKKNKQSGSDSNADPPVKPLSLSYNSYENQTDDANTPPVIIMHGK